MESKCNRDIDIVDVFRPFFGIINLYRNIIFILIDIVDKAYDDIKDMKEHDAINYITDLVHSTKGRKKNGVMQKGKTAVYREIELMYPSTPIPKELILCAVTFSIAQVKLYRTNHETWEKEDWNKRGGEPQLQRWHKAYPVFYRGTMYAPEKRNGKHGARVRLYDEAKNEFYWYWVQFNQADVRNTQLEFDYRDESCPHLKQKGDRFAFSFNCSSKGKVGGGSRICSVDIGLNHLATMVILEEDGSIVKVGFFDLPEMMETFRKIIREKNQLKSEGKDPASYYHYITNFNREIAIRVATAIVRFALQYNAGTIIMEHLSKHGRIGQKRKNSEVISLWRPVDLRERVENLAHRHLLSFSTVSAFNTSKLAYDGSGKVERNKENAAVCVFKNGRQFNTDLSAALNIGARYLIRKLIENHKKQEEMLYEAIPDARNKNKRVWAHYIEMQNLFGIPTKAKIPEGKKKSR